ncbi:MAG: GAF domain-containing protein [Anaerolineales bacterium]
MEQIQKNRQFAADLIIANVVNRGDSLWEIFDLLAQEARRIFPGCGTATFVLSPQKDRLTVQNISLPSSAVKQIEALTGLDISRVRMSFKVRGLYREVLQLGKPGIVSDPEIIRNLLKELIETIPLSEDDRQNLQERTPQIQNILGIQTLIAIPLVSHEAAIGLLSLSHTSPPQEIDHERLVAIAGQMTTAIARRQAKRNLADKVAALEALSRIGVAMSSTLDTSALLRLILEQAARLVGAASGSVLLLDGKTGELVFHVSADPIIGMRVPPGQGVAGRVMQSGIPEIVHDVTVDPDFYAGIEQASGIQSRSLLAVPLLVEARSIGVLMAINKLRGRFRTQDQDLLVILASHAAIALQNARLYEQAQTEIVEREMAEATLRESEKALHQYTERLTLLVNTSAIVSTSLDMDTVLPVVAEQILQASTADNFTLFSLDSTGDSLIVQLDYSSGSGQALGAPGTIYHLADFPAAQWVVEQRKPLSLQATDPQADQAKRVLLQTKSLQTTIMVPMVVRDQVTGLLKICSKAYILYTPNEIDLIQTLANQIASAQENARLFHQVQRHAAELEQRVAKRTVQLEKLYRRQSALAEIELSINQPRELQDVLERIAEVTTQLLPASGGASVILWDAQTETFSIGSSTVPKVLPGGIQHIRKRGGATRWIVDNRHSLAVDNVHKDPFGDASTQVQHDLQAYVGVPLLAEGKALGVLYAHDKEPRQYTSEDVEFLSALASRAATAITKVQLYETAQRRAQEAETLRQAGAVVAATLQQNEAIERILKQLELVVPHDSASVQLLSGDFLEIVGGRGWPNPDKVVGLRFPIPGDNPNTLVIQGGEPVILNNSPTKTYSIFRKKTHRHILSWLGVPLIVHDEIIGMLALDSTQPGYFTPDRARLASAFANQVAVAIDNARLFENVQYLATIDELTGIYNRRHFFELGEVEFERARRYQHPLSAIMLDIDHFKKINDTYRHASGDQVLRSLARICLESIRKVDILGRYGGEEFTILLPETPLPKACEVAERLRKIVGETSILINGGELSITVSLGVATTTKENIPDLASLLDLADTALYRAKNLGRNRVEVFDWQRV